MAALSSGWWTGPREEGIPLGQPPQSSALSSTSSSSRGGDLVGESHDPSRPILCLSVFEDDIVTGSADHSLIVFSRKTYARKRTLYSKRYGHTDWVTCVAHAPDGRVCSGGGDAKICVWDRTAVKCTDLVEHKGSISRIETDSWGLAVSSSYDCSLRIWDLNRLKCISVCSGHVKPVTTFAWSHSAIASGGRDGSIRFWDIHSGECVTKLRPHDKQVLCCSFCGENPDDKNVLVSGSQDGYLCITDLRSGKMEMKIAAGGSVNGISSSHLEDSSLLISGTSNGLVNGHDLRAEYNPVFSFSDHQHPVTTLRVQDGLIASGAGNGWILVHDILSSKCLYGVGASKIGAVQALEMLPSQLVTASDDGSALVFEMDD